MFHVQRLLPLISLYRCSTFNVSCRSSYMLHVHVHATRLSAIHVCTCSYNIIYILQSKLTTYNLQLQCHTVCHMWMNANSNSRFKKKSTNETSNNKQRNRALPVSQSSVSYPLNLHISLATTYIIHVCKYVCTTTLCGGGA